MYTANKIVNKVYDRYYTANAMAEIRLEISNPIQRDREPMTSWIDGDVTRGVVRAHPPPHRRRVANLLPVIGATN